MNPVRTGQKRLRQQLDDVAAGLRNAAHEVAVCARQIDQLPAATDPAHYGEPGAPSAAWIVCNVSHDLLALFTQLRLDDVANQAAEVDVLMTQAWRP